MTVFDWFLVVIFALAALWGLKTGLIDSVLTVVSVYVALLLSGQFAFRMVNFFTDDIENRAVATAIGYLVIFILVFIGARLLGMFLRTGVKFLMLTWVDRIGGVVFGALAGVLLVAGMVAVTARFTYNPDTKVPIIVEIGSFRDNLREWMVDGRVPSLILDIRAGAPADVLGILPSGFGDSLDALEEDIADQKGTGS